jgi:hypothetical protein
MSIDTVIRIAFAMTFFFVIVPALALSRRETATVLERFFWNFGVGIILITLVGQIFTLANLFSIVTLLLTAGVIILLGRSADRGVPPWTLVKQSSETAFLAVLNIFDGRVNVRRRIRRRYRRTIAALRQKTDSRAVRLQLAGWIGVVGVAGGLRLYRPFASANLGFSDTYVHLYLLKLLEEGRQVDPQWGPYPRGMHFLLMSIHHLTNVDQILLMNFFGAFVGVLMTLAVADTARRLSRSVVAGLVAGFLFATLIGGASQYFVMGGAFATNDASLATSLAGLPYAEVPRAAGEFDFALTDFQRQTSTLSQELAIVLLFPAAMFLINFFRSRERWDLIGFAGCTAAIAAVHSGVVFPLILMCAVILLVLMIHRSLTPGTLRRVLLTGTVAVLIGSTWILGFIVYPYAGGKNLTSPQSSVGGTVLYYFPFVGKLIRPEGGAVTTDETRIFVTLTPFLIACIVLAIALAVVSFRNRDNHRVNLLWISLLFVMFLIGHFASMLRLPQIVEQRRNSQWLIMSMTILIGVAIVEIGSFVRFIPTRRAVPAAASVLSLLLILWTIRVPRLTDPLIHDRIVNYSGWGGSALAVLNIERRFDPYTWTLVSYGQEFPMVLRRGFHLPAADFLDRYDPTLPVIPIPTPQIFVIVEKTPHPFQINTWSEKFSRAELEQRLQTWIHLYQATHRNLRVFLEDKNVRVYQIERTPEEVERASREARQ